LKDSSEISSEQRLEDLTSALRKVLSKSIDDFADLISCDRLSGGANQETYRIAIKTSDGIERLLAMRRAAGGNANQQEAICVGLPTEARLFQIARDAGIPAPEIHHVLSRQDGLGDGFIMSWLSGETLGHKIVHASEFDDIRPTLAKQCGQILAKIHAIDLTEVELDQRLLSTTPQDLVANTWERYRELDTPQPMIDYAGRWLEANCPTQTRSCLVHNDFRNGNLMIDKSGVIGVLDWEIAHIGDPMRDLGWLCTNSWRFGRSDLPVGGFGHYPDLIAGYEAESGIKIDRANLKYWEVFGSFWWAIGCLRMGQQYRDGPDRSVERPAISRRSSECQVDCVNLLIPGPVDLVDVQVDYCDDNLPPTNELLDSVAKFLLDDIGPATDGRLNFFTKVASNSLRIVKREISLGPAAAEQELAGLRTLFQCEDSLTVLRWRLVAELREGNLPLDDSALIEHLRSVTVNRLAIDQPKYSGFKTAIQ
jgi:aminoglycoside phosphotransferase (APT) family kinase protein